MDDDELGAPTRGLCRYMGLVSQALDQHQPACCYDDEDRSSVYVALSQRLARYPDRDLALLWDEANGWAIGIESGCRRLSSC